MGKAFGAVLVVAGLLTFAGLYMLGGTLLVFQGAITELQKNPAAAGVSAEQAQTIAGPFSSILGFSWIWIVIVAGLGVYAIVSGVSMIRAPGRGLGKQ